MAKVVLITGTSTGIGREAVLHLAKAGCKVMATARNPRDIDDLVGPNVSTLALDVTNPAQRKAAVEATIRTFGRIDVLVNNAGFGAMLSVEDTSDATLRRMYETNVFGLHALTQEVLPHLRAQGSGRIVNVASIAGHVSVPMMGAYCSTKFAVRALTQALAVELKPFGIQACLIEPGVIKTNFGTHSRSESKAAGADYDGPYGRMYRRWAASRDKRQGKHPRIIAKRVVRAATARHPRFHYFAPFLDAKATNIAKRVVPDRMLNWAFGLYFNR